ncbi:nitrate assimilation regulatory nirA [Fusarium pseudocircinatum]|uniref:Nitrate assimilation regulatory nirA n=1 Tax=Fusarium pseudocircinatum TaxID=56676 RepID=A0A8H5PKD7_9HYPO|nr:nitrate assimilation regulatory nirA [Fusarium pseudocircinatum]
METPSSITLRPILPRPSATPVPTPPAPKRTSDLAIPRKTKVISACQACKLKKIKCDGDRPECGPCISKGRDCEYPIHGNRAEVIIRRQQALQENVESFGALYRYLQERPAKEASSLFDRIRDGFGIEAALEFVKREDNTSTLACRDPPSARVEWSQRIYDCNLLFENELLSTETSDVAIQALRDGVDCYFLYMGNMFPIYTRKEADSIIDTFQEAKPDQVDTRKVAYGELLAISALGFQYDRQTLPNGNASICTPFYQKARLFLDYVVEQAPLRAMRICCCLGIYNVIAKSSLAISYTDWGILLGSSSGLSVGNKPPGLSKQDFNGYIKTFTALITLRSWVTATLGNIPSPEVSRCIHDTREQIDNTDALDSAAEDPVLGVLQQKMAQITVLKANVVRTVASFRVLFPTILRQMHDDLESWRSSLPAYMHLESLVHTPAISPDQRRVTFYMHLFYMSALILKTRAVLAAQRDIAACTWDPEAKAAISGGIHAARRSARLLGLILEEKAVVKNCWLTMYQCYITFLMLNFTAIKSFLVGGSAAFKKQDVTLSRICIEILALCATKDRIAHSFHTRLTRYQEIIKANLPDSADSTTLDPSFYKDGPLDDDSYLFIESTGDPRLHHLMYELRELLCYPLTLLKGGSDVNLPYPTIVEASVNADINFAHHLASPFNMAEDEVPNGLFPPEDSLNDYEAGTEGYISGSVPFGWDFSAWRRDPGVGSLDNT